MARRSKRNRTPGGRAQASPPPFPYPEGPRGFRLRWLNSYSLEDEPFFQSGSTVGTTKVGQFCRNLPDDLMERTQWIDRHMIKGPGQDVPEAWCATLFHGMHQGWQAHRERGIQGFLTEQIRMMGGLEEVNKLGGLVLSVEVLPEGRRVETFVEPHIVMALEPDGEFCRLLVTEYWGVCAVGVAAEADMDAVLGPVSVVVKGTVLSDGKPYAEGEPGAEPTLMLIDPLTVLADLGPVHGVAEDGRLELWDDTTMGRMYHPDDDAARRFMHPAQRKFMDLWEGKVPGFVGRIGSFGRRIAAAQAERRKRDEAEQAKLPVNPQYMEALERQLETARFVRHQHPFATVRREMRLSPSAVDYDALIGETLETATTHYWVGHMCDLLSRSFVNLPEWRLRPQEVGPRRGYMWFATPIRILEDDPEVLRAMVWVNDGSNYAFVPFTTYEGPGSEFVNSTFGRLSHGAPRHAMLWQEGQSLSDWITHQEENYHFIAAQSEHLSGNNQRIDLAQRLAWGRIFATAIAIMNQVLVKSEPYGPDRPARKRIEKLRPPGLEPPAPVVRAVMLRRQYTVQRGAKVEGEHIDWRYQWKVSEHWRQQWYPSLNEHKWILILEHIKGPPDKPLKTPLPIKIVGR